MEFVQEGKDNYMSEEDGEGRRETINFNLFPNCSSDYSKYTHPWDSSSSRSAMELSLGNSSSSTRDEDGVGTVGVAVEREHMFDKVVTPSDVGKLNRLVIPKQHAEKYFPLESGSSDKGLLLNFEDRNGKPWRFRYSYWNSSQSYVMTKGWSRFVKDKKLDAGDIVSFHRGLPDHAKDRLFIDWRRRPHTPLPHRWASARLYSLPPPPYNYPLPPPPPYNYPLINNNYPHNNYHYAPANNNNYHLGFSHPPEPVYYLRSAPSGQQFHGPGHHVPMVIDSVPLLHGRSTGKNKLRLFGVNMECEMSGDDDRLVLPSTALLLHVSAPPQPPPQFSDKGKSSLSFDLDP